MSTPRSILLTQLLTGLTVMLAACGGSSGGGATAPTQDVHPPAQGGDLPPGGGQPPNTGTLTPWAISDAGNTGTATNIFEVGDSFTAEPDIAKATARWDTLFATLSAKRQWTGSNPRNTYQFYVDTNAYTNWGRAFRYTGYDVHVGPIRTPAGGGVLVGAGTYRRADGRTFDAMVLQTWDNTHWQLLVMADNNTFVGANQHFNGYPVLETFRGS